MFDPSDRPRLFALAPGVDFPAALISGLRARLQAAPPHAMAEVDLIVNTRRMARRLRDLFDAGPAGFLPRIRLLGDVEALLPSGAIPAAISPLRRRLELSQLISRLLDADPDIAPRTSLFALSDSLAKLIDEMQGEGVPAQAISDLDVTDASGHWDRTKRFIEIAQAYLDQMNSQPDAEARQRQIVERLVRHWQENPPRNPVLVAGSTGSRGTTSMLMQAVAQLPQGALILPGFDFDMPYRLWQTIEQGDPPEDHPQYRFFDLIRKLSVTRADVMPWDNQPAPSAPRNALVSLSLRPAPVTDTWRTEGPRLESLHEATRDITVLEAQTPRTEALCIALRLRKAVQDGQTAALITPDRMLTRQVTAALDRWNILPDDSAGTPLHLSPPGRFLRHVAGLLGRKLDAEALLTLLKHPLTHSGEGRNQHQLNTQRFEMQVRRDGLPYPDAAGIRRIGARAAPATDTNQSYADWVGWVADTFAHQNAAKTQALAVWCGKHLELSSRIAAGSEQTAGDEHELWKRKAGQKAQEVMQSLETRATYGGEMSARDYADLVHAMLSAEEVRDRDAPHPGVMIWGTLEARVQGASLVILGGLNDGTWPETPPADLWLNRRMRQDAGLLLPERRIGLSAHDYQQAIAAPEVWLTRSIRTDEAETVPSRWLNRLANLLNGLPQEAGQAAWSAMQHRGAYWLEQAKALEAFDPVAPAPRPSPKPPVSARPTALSVTEIKRLIRDPYAIYARHTLRLRPINPLVQEPDALIRGITLHDIMERFIASVVADPSLLTRAHLLDLTDTVLGDHVPWPTARLMWRARMMRVADWFIAREQERQTKAAPILLEKAARGQYTFADLGFTLRGIADRIDMTSQGEALIYDYKTGAPPSAREQRFFDKQLLLEAAMIEQGGFDSIGPTPVKGAFFIGLGSKPVEVAAPLDTETPQVVLAGLHELIAAYQNVTQGFTSRRIVRTEDAPGDYDQLARFGEWDGTHAAVPEDLI